MTEDRVARNTRRGISWNLVATIVSNAARVAVLVILGRKLTTDDNGLVAAAVTVNSVIFALRDLGLGQALVQRKEIVPAHVETTWTVSLFIGAGATVGLWFAAPLIASMYRMANLADIVRGLAPLFLMSGASVVSRALCQRELRFATIASIDIVAFLSGAVASVVLAVQGAGPWALVIGYLIEEAIASTAYLVVRAPPFRLGIELSRLRELLKYGANQTAAQITGILAIQADNAIVGRYWGGAYLGVYGKAYDLVKFPSMVFTAVVGNVLFSSFARVQDDIERVAQGFKRGLYVNALLLLPGSAWLIICAPEIVTGLIGPQWGQAVLPFQILAATILFRTSQKLSVLVVQTQGQVSIVPKIYFGYMVIVIVGSTLAVPFGIAAVAISTSICITLNTIAMTFAAIRLTNSKTSDVLLSHVPGVFCAAAVTMVCWPLTSALRDQHWSRFPLLAATGVAGALVALLTMVLSKRLRHDDYMWLLSQLPGRKRKR